MAMIAEPHRSLASSIDRRLPIYGGHSMNPSDSTPSTILPSIS